ncbi:MAG: S8 family serine peptidase, partial [Sphingomonadaceae bacterium]|nr:S8 family serine peptidase [Sphingomonadaceae bacterium]
MPAGDGCTHDDKAIASGLDLAVSARARVVNISLGGEPANGTLRAAIDRATSAGVIIVISAGNDFDTDPIAGANPDPLAQIATDPIAHGLVLIAGAVDGAHAIASFSNRAGNGASVFIDALGVRVRSIDQTGATFLFSGTSFSAPAVAGAVALIAQAFPTLTPAQIVDLLLRTATDLGDPGTDAVYGRGELNLARAFAPQGQTSLSGSTVPVSLTANATLSAPMGDAAQTGMAATIRDSYGRDFAVDLSPTIARSPRASRLAPGLTLDMRSAATQAGPATLALSVAGGAPRQMLLTRDQAESARVLAGSVAMRLGPATQVMLGLAQSADLQGAREPAFLVADRAGGIERAPKAAFALRQRLGGIRLTVAAENGDLRLWERSELGPRG